MNPGDWNEELSQNFISHLPELVTDEDNSELNKQVEEDEILKDINQFNPDKAPGPDGFTIHFYKRCWSIIKFDYIRMLRYVHRSYRLGGATNSDFLSLLPKEKGSSSFDRFRLISLCNVSYKIMAKIISNRLKPLLNSSILPNQWGFVACRKIWDNIILFQEAIHSSHNPGEKGMTIKIDMANAFDRVNHEFLKYVLKKIGFTHHFISWINSCIAHPWIAMLINGRLAPFFQATRGLR
jgi:hypothetical protein